MKTMFRRGTALTLALLLILGQLALPASADDSATPPETNDAPETIISDPLPVIEVPVAVENAPVDIPSAPGGETETVEVDIAVSADPETGNITATATVQEGTDSNGAEVTAESTVVVQPNGDGTGTIIDEETSYEVTSADGNYTAEGGKEITVETSHSDVEVEIVEDGELVDNGQIAVGGETTTVVTAADEGDKLKSEDSANFDQITTIESERLVEVEVDSSTTTSGDPEYVAEKGDTVYRDAEGKVVGYCDQQGNLVGTETENGETLTEGGNLIYRDNEGKIVGFVDDDGNLIGSMNKHDGYTWGYDHNGTGFGRVEWYLESKTNSDEEPIKVDSGRVNEKHVVDEDGNKKGGLYCADTSTDFLINKPYDYVNYRLVNVEDAVESGYYQEEDAAHLNAIMTHGYSFGGEAQLAQIQAELKNAKENGSDEEKALLAELKIDELTIDDVATATNAAVWYYGNRFAYDEENYNLTVKLTGVNESQAMIFYNYLMGLQADPIQMEKDNTSTQIINEESFIEDMTFTVEEKAAYTTIDTNNDGVDNNSDFDDTNDVYNTTIKFSLVVMPDPVGDDLLVSVLNKHGDVERIVRIAGENKEGQTYDKIQAENGYFTIEGLALTENENNTFNLKLEGTQLLETGVYVFESEVFSDEETLERFGKIQGYASGEEYKNAVLQNARDRGMNEEEAQAYLRKTIETYNAGQNFIGTYSGSANVDVSTQINFSFNVEEAKKVTIHEWREETQTQPVYNDPQPVYYDPMPINDEFGGVAPAVFVAAPAAPAPAAAVPMLVELEDAPVPMEHAPDNITVILDEEVPLAAAPGTGDASVIWAIMGMMSMGGYIGLGKKAKKEEEEA